MSSTTSKTRERSSPEELLLREDEAYRWSLLRKSPQWIADRLGVSDRQVRNYIAAAKTRAVEELQKLEGRAGVQRQFAILTYAQDEAMEAWERSKEPKGKKVASVEELTLGRGDENGAVANRKKKTQKTEEDRIGDPKYLELLMKSSSELRDLLGLDAPTVKRLLIQDNVVDLTDDELDKLDPAELLRQYQASLNREHTDKK